MADAAYPLGEPVNRKPAPGLTPVVGRPNWWRHPYTGVEQYIEPKKPAPSFDIPLQDISDEPDLFDHCYVGDEE